MPAPDLDAVTRFLFEALDVRGAFVRMGPAWQAMQDGRGYDDTVRDLLGELTATSVLIGSQLKQPGRLTVQLKGHGPVSLLLVDVDEQLRLRGMARADAEVAGSDVPTLLGDGKLVITLQPDQAPNAYQSVVPMEGESIATIFELFLEQSEQQSSALWLAADAHACAGLFLQKLPEADQKDADGWARVHHLASTVQREELLTLDTEMLLQRLFAEDIVDGGVRVFRARPVVWHCPRDWGKVRHMLRTLGREEIDAIIAEHGEVVIRDDICNHEYRLGPEEVDALFDDDAGDDVYDGPA
jgi:molecular chaperone Hsp33